MSSKFFQFSTHSCLPFLLPSSDTRGFPNLPFQSHHVHPTLSPHKPVPFFSLPPIRSCRPLLASTSQNSEPSPSELQDAQEAVSSFLQEFGLSQQESSSIAINSPSYVRMLVDGVRDLDEFSLWDSNGVGVGIGLGLKEKVCYMAKQKGDNGKVAYLESLGLSLSSAMNVARYVSSDTLPNLIQKVNYMKEVLFSDSETNRIPVKNARRMMMQLSIPADDDLQHTLSFYEKIEARRGGLNLLGSEETSFRFLVESFPRILLLSVKSHLKPLVEFLENIGICRERIRNVILLFPPLMLWNIETVKTRILVFKEIGVVDDDFGKLLLKYPWILSTSIQENYKEVLSFFALEKVPRGSVCRAVRSLPHLLGCSTAKLKLMVEQFGELGVHNRKLGQVIAKSPQILLQKPQEFLQVVLFFEDLGFNRDTAGKIFTRCPEVIAASIEGTLKRKLDFLSSIGVSKVHLPRVIKKYPELLVSDVESTLLPRMTYLMQSGLSGKDISFMVRTFSPLLGYSIEEVLRPKIEFLVNTMERPIRDAVGYPRFFSYSLEKKIKPRFWVLKGRNIKCSLKDMLAKNDEEFATEFMGVERMLVNHQ